MNKTVRTILLGLFLWFTSGTLLAGGWITIRSSVLGATVLVDQGDEMVMHDKQLCLSLDQGLHLVMVNKEGYRPYVDTVTVKERVNHIIEAQLEPLNRKAQKDQFNIRWAAIGVGAGTGLNFRVSLFDMQYSLLRIDPCVWGANLPFFSGVSHVQVPWQVHQRDRRSEIQQYPMAIPTQEIQFYYAPQVGVQLPFSSNAAFVLSAGPQISWTRVAWTYQYRDLPQSYRYVFTEDEFPSTGYQFDPVWFSVQAGVLFTKSLWDTFLYFHYQDGYFIGIEFRF